MSILGTAFRGAGALLGIAEDALYSRVLGHATAGVIGAVAKNPIRTLGVAAFGIGGIGALGIAGKGPLSNVGEEYARFRRSEYGDTPAVERSLSALRVAGTIGGIGMLGVAGAGLFGKGPLGVDYAGMATRKGEAIMAGFSRAGGGITRLGGKATDAAADAYFNIGGRSSGVRVITDPPRSMKRGRGAWKRQRKQINKTLLGGPMQGPPRPPPEMQGPPEAPYSFGDSAKAFGKAVLKRKGWGSFIAGSAIGAGAGLNAANVYYNNSMGYEGTLQGISSSSSGGISPELQYSHQGLVFALHRNNKSMRRRYQ